MSSEPATDPERGQGKGRKDDDSDSDSDDPDDPAEDFEDDPDSDAAADAQQTLNEIDPDSDSVDIDGQDTFTASDLQNDDVAQELGDRLGLSDDGVEQMQSLAESDITPDASDTVNIDNAAEFEQFEVGNPGEPEGGSSEAMWLGTTEDGTTMFITFDNAESVGDPLAGSAMAKAVDESLGDGDIQVDFPDINVDTERGAAVLENVGAEDSRPAGNYAPFMADGDFSKDEYLAAIGSKLMIGDTDHGGNVVASSDGDFHPIDFDISGRDLQQINDRTGGRLFDGMENEASQYTELYDFDINDGDLRDVTTQLAQQVDMDTLESQLASSEAISQKERETVIDNVTALRQGDL